MDYAKPQIENDAVYEILGKIFPSKIEDLKVISTGQIAQTFSFSHSSNLYFISFNYSNMSQVINTEKYFYQKFIEMNIPVREIVESGKLKELYYLITKKVEGKEFHLLDEKDQMTSLISVYDTFFNIDKINTNNRTGYGWLDINCNGMFPSWPDHISKLIDEDKSDFYGEWHKLFDTTFLNKKIFEEYYMEMKKLITYIPNERKLVHGGFGYGNILVNYNKVSAIIDWQDARYGDNIFDIAYMLFWRSKEMGNKFMEVFRDYVNRYNFDASNIEERIKCYKYYIGLDSIRFFAKSNNKNAYENALKILKSI